MRHGRYAVADTNCRKRPFAVLRDIHLPGGHQLIGAKDDGRIFHRLNTLKAARIRKPHASTTRMLQTILFQWKMFTPSSGPKGIRLKAASHQFN
jgi:hypothetical protein